MMALHSLGCAEANMDVQRHDDMLHKTCYGGRQARWWDNDMVFIKQLVCVSHNIIALCHCGITAFACMPGLLSLINQSTSRHACGVHAHVREYQRTLCCTHRMTWQDYYRKLMQSKSPSLVNINKHKMRIGIELSYQNQLHAGGNMGLPPSTAYFHSLC